MLDIIIFGGPGSGKGTQGKKLAQELGLRHISTGQLLRNHIAQGTELGKIADSYISKGQLIPDDLMLEVLEQTLKDDPEAKGVIFDGFPRSLPQAEALDKLLEKLGRKVEAVIGLEVPDEELQRRVLERGDATGREDDNLETIGKRLKVYHNTTAPLRDYYHEHGKYRPIDGTAPIDDIFYTILDTLK